MGITTIQHHRTREHIIAVGSYDENIRIFDTRMMKKTPLTSVSVGSGVWRVKWNPNPKYQDLLAVAKMRSGFGCYSLNMNSTDTDSTSWALKELVEFRNSEIENCSKSLAYGIDWNPSLTPSPLLTVTCSFYDSKIDLWNVEM
jgi:diphthamide biosynthesis protein 7